MVVIFGMGEEFRVDDMESISRIDTQCNPADAMIKTSPNLSFRRVLRSNDLRHPIVKDIGHGNIADKGSVDFVNSGIG